MLSAPRHKPKEQKLNINQDLITKAWLFASRAHKEQKYPGEELPYITHIGNVALEVMSIANTLSNPNLAICCAILHDTIEDTDITYEDIYKEFGKDIANGVNALSKDKTLPKDKQMTDSLNRILQQPKEVWVVKMADRVSNLGKPPHYWSLEKKMQYQNEAELILKELQNANQEIAQRLKNKIENYSRYFKE